MIAVGVPHSEAHREMSAALRSALHSDALYVSEKDAFTSLKAVGLNEDRVATLFARIEAAPGAEVRRTHQNSDGVHSAVRAYVVGRASALSERDGVPWHFCTAIERDHQRLKRPSRFFVLFPAASAEALREALREVSTWWT